jgi:hypothetical protein
MKEYAGGAATLADLEVQGAGLMLWCRSCGHHAPVPITDALDRYGPDQLVMAIRGRCRCCGSRFVSARAAWPAGLLSPSLSSEQ